jgi:hypothetical protein
MLDEDLAIVEVVEERVEQLRGRKEEDDAKEDGDGQRRQRLLVDGQQQQRAGQALNGRNAREKNGEMTGRLI